MKDFTAESIEVKLRDNLDVLREFCREYHTLPSKLLPLMQLF